MSTFSTPISTAAEQMLSNYQRMLQAFSAPKVLQAMQRVQVGATPKRVVSTEDSVQLLQYETDVERRYETPLLLVFALVNRPYILDLRTGKSVVSHFVRHGFDTYNMDWGAPQDGDRHLGLRDYVLRYIHHAVEHVCRRSGSEQVSILGYCMGGTMSAIYTALRPQRVRNLILLTAPVDWSQRDNLLSLWTDERYFDVDKLLAVYGNAPAHWLQTSFQMLKPVQNMIEKYIGFAENMHDEKWLDDFFAMEKWLNDNIPVAGEVFREFVKHMFQQNQLIQGKLEVAGERVDLKRITCPVLNLIAQNDHLVPPNQSHSFNDAVSSKDRKTITFPAGHIGMAVGSKAHRELWPKVCDWLAERSDEAK